MDVIQQKIVLAIANRQTIKSVRELMKITGYKVNAICKHTDILVSQGIIIKERYGDQKKKKMCLTDKGEMLASALEELYRCYQ